MAIRKRIGKRGNRWIVDYRDNTGKRHWITCRTKAEAEQVHAKKVQEPGGNPNLTVGDIAREWLAVSESKVRKQSYDVYEQHLRIHILPALDKMRLSKIRPAHIEMFLASKLKEGLKPRSVGSICTTLFGIFRRAVKEGIIASNPVDGVSTEMGLRRKSTAQRLIKAFTPAELELFLEKTKDVRPHLYPLFLTMARTGIRIGEAVALRWPDVDLEGRPHGGRNIYQITVERSMRRDGRFEPTKSGRVRRVDMSRSVRETLRRVHKQQLEESMRRGRTEQEDWVFQRPPAPANWKRRGKGNFLRAHSVDTQFKLVLEAAELPLHFYPHCLRHTFASMHFAKGNGIGYIKEQLGHASIQMTYDTYGHWLSKTDMKAAESLDAAVLDSQEHSGSGEN